MIYFACAAADVLLQQTCRDERKQLKAFHADACVVYFCVLNGLVIQPFSGMANLTEAIVSDEQLAIIARKFLTKWEELSPSLGLTQQQEESIRRTLSDYEDQKRESLRWWKRNKGNKATFGAFIAAAESISNMQLADSLRDLIIPLQGYINADSHCVFR